MSCRFFLISSWFNTTVTVCWKHLLSFLLTGFIAAFFFLSSQESLYTIYHGLDLFYDVYNTINNQTHKTKTNSLPFINFSKLFWKFIKEWFKGFFYNFICFIINYDFYVITFWMHYTLFIIVFRKNRVSCFYWLNFPCIQFSEIINDIF